MTYSDYNVKSTIQVLIVYLKQRNTGNKITYIMDIALTECSTNFKLLSIHLITVVNLKRAQEDKPHMVAKRENTGLKYDLDKIYILGTKNYELSP